MFTEKFGSLCTALQLLQPETDGELLRRFVLDRDEQAFARLVARYGRFVLATCRRIVPDVHLADDAFQATFLVLARKANALDGTRRLGPWLYGVAVNVATRARDGLGRRRRHETLTRAVPETATPPQVPDDAVRVLDEEITALSSALREAVVLCELQGLSRKEAAEKLGIAEGTLSSRLAAARKKLAERLTSRGVSPAMAVAVTIVPERLHAATVATAVGQVPPGSRLHLLPHSGTEVTLLATLKVCAALAVLVVLLVFGGRRGGESAAAPVPKDSPDPGVIWLKHEKRHKLVAYKPSGKKVTEINARDAYLDTRTGLIWTYDPKAGKVTGTNLDGANVKEVACPGHFFGFSDDGTKVMFAGTAGEPRNKPAGEEPLWLNGCRLHYQDVTGKGDVTATDIPLNPHGWFHWLPDGKGVIKAEPMTMKAFVLHSMFNAETKKTSSLGDRDSSPRIDVRQMLCGISPDGEWLFTQNYVPANLVLSRVPFRGGDPERLATPELRPAWALPSPNGRLVACLGYATPRSDKAPGRVPAVRVVNVRTREVSEGTRHEDGV
ncbi:hypothetical protein FTUN_8653 [Frigoriglobus tundricola]|uniref:HTH luxR-type domain-containing protein n=2 Tax=Frigoriglobus tundricola TaxID=2774151 RepID=A0A6M5Z5N8_9BACT|nr:hypothetical protein FTUN_8653 [Frigoriglobus tundricola]